jgi:anti-sigma regulatory factor (Ser/Thr protein kinase)
MHGNPLLHLLCALGRMVHVHLHDHLRSHGVLHMRTQGSVVLEPLWHELLAAEELGAPGATAVSCEFELPPCFESVKDARDFAMTTLRRWNLVDLFDAVALVASELVTNALRHGVPRGSTHCGPIQLCLIRRASRVVCAVRDPSDEGPVSKEPDFISESGRGLHLVDCFSDTWGWHPLAGAGKVVWALFHSAGEALPGMAAPSQLAV